MKARFRSRRKWKSITTHMRTGMRMRRAGSAPQRPKRSSPTSSRGKRLKKRLAKNQQLPMRKTTARIRIPVSRREWCSRFAGASSAARRKRAKWSSRGAFSVRAKASTCSTASCAGCATFRTSSWAPAWDPRATPSLARSALGNCSAPSPTSAEPSSKRRPE